MNRLLIHTVALVVINLMAIVVGLRWDEFVKSRHPFAAQIPLGTLAVVFGFLGWFHGINGLDAGRWRLHGKRAWLFLYLVPIVTVPTFYFLLPGAPAPSGGRIGTVFLFVITVNAITLGLVAGQQNFDSASWLRNGLKNRWGKTILRISGVVTVTIVLWGTIEGFCYLRNRVVSATGPTKVYHGEYLKPGQFSQWDERLGTSLVPNANAGCRLTIGERSVWDVRYTTDEWGRRTTVNPEGSNADKYAIFFGCSFLFGEGANDDETIPSQFAAAAPSFKAYNYGVPGYGTQQMLAKLQTGTIRQEVTESTGIALYLYLEDVHEPRVIGDMQVSNSFAWNFPYYDFNSDGEVQHYGTMTSGRPRTSKLYWMLGRSQFIRMTGLNFPRARDDHYRLVAEIAAESQRLCQRNLNCKDFYVLMYPCSNPHKRLLKHLDSAGIRYLDYSKLFDPESSEYCHVGDGHPSSLANRGIAEKLASDFAMWPATIKD